MSDLSITAANVKIKGSDAALRVVQFGETMTAGMTTYLKTSDNKYWKADANASLEASKAVGVVITGASGDAYGVICESGPIDIGATLTVGVPIIVSTTAGGAAPASDFSGYSGAFEHHLGYPTSTSTLYLRPYATGAAN